MPELPEVETTRRGIEPHVVGRRIARLLVHDRRLRWPVDLALVTAVTGSAIRRAGRRAKYLLLETDAGTLILTSAGMSHSEEVIRAARELNPSAYVLARTAYLRDMPILQHVGADGVFAGEGEVALAFTEALLDRLGATPEQLDRERDRAHKELFGRAEEAV